jgi:hypothetical protein
MTMQLNCKTLPFWTTVLIFLLGAASCTPASSSNTITRAPTETIENQALVTIELTPTFSKSNNAEEQKSTPTPVATETPQDIVPTSTPAKTSTESEPLLSYVVINVEEDDVLNVRSTPGPENPTTGTLDPGQGGITVTGPASQQSGSLWVPIRQGEVNGWVNSYYLTVQIEDETFCADDRARSILDQTIEAIDSKDGEKLSELVDAERGLRIQRHWWNPVVKFDQEDLKQVFISEELIEWGIADGTGEPIVGSFRSVILPLLDRNLVLATDSACGELLHGGTAGIVQLPPLFEGINYYSVYRPAGPEEIEFDWGSWAVGIEKDPEDYFLSYLVHYEWEI